MAMTNCPDSCDVAVVGGGFSGLGVAQEAAQRGFHTVLVEKDSCCQATSANSLRIIHGGLRYLQSLDIGRALDSAREQHYWLAEAPAAVKSLPCFLPLRRYGLKSRWPLWIAGRVFDGLSRHCCGRTAGTGIVSREYVEERVPQLRGAAPYGALLWQDALVDDFDGFVAIVRARAENAGVMLCEQSSVSRVSARDRGFQVTLKGEGWVSELRARVVVNTTGPWLGMVSPEPGMLRRRFPAGWCKAFNVVLNRQLEQRYAFGLSCPDSRVLFFVPRGEGTAAGTWYVPFQDSPDRPEVSTEEVEQFLNSCNRALPGLSLRLGDVEKVEVGILPMRKVGRAGPVLYGAHRLFSQGAFLDVMSTKFTTFRSQAASVMDAAQAYLR